MCMACIVNIVCMLSVQCYSDSDHLGPSASNIHSFVRSFVLVRPSVHLSITAAEEFICTFFDCLLALEHYSSGK